MIASLSSTTGLLINSLTLIVVLIGHQEVVRSRELRQVSIMLCTSDALAMAAMQCTGSLAVVQKQCTSSAAAQSVAHSVLATSRVGIPSGIKFELQSLRSRSTSAELSING